MLWVRIGPSSIFMFSIIICIDCIETNKLNIEQTFCSVSATSIHPRDSVQNYAYCIFHYPCHKSSITCVSGMRHLSYSLSRLSQHFIQGVFTKEISIFLCLWHPLVGMWACCHLSLGASNWSYIISPKSGPVEPTSEAQWGLFLDGFPWIIAFFIIHYPF